MLLPEGVFALKWKKIIYVDVLKLHQSRTPPVHRCTKKCISNFLKKLQN